LPEVPVAPVAAPKGQGGDKPHTHQAKPPSLGFHCENYHHMARGPL
jgi:hypothetical protein